jgi:NADH-quinone oxidoreductase subunit N
MLNLRLLWPEMTLAALSLLLLTADIWLKGARGKALYHMGILVAAMTLGVIGLSYSAPDLYQGIGTLWIVDPMSQFFKVLILATTILVLLQTIDYNGPEENLGAFTALVLLASTGLMLLVSSSDLLMVFLSLELVSITSFILVGFDRKSAKASEGAMKYYLIGAFSAAIMVYGISLFYGATGSTQLANVPLLLTEGTSTMFVMGCVLILVGFGFKVSMAPFHFWVADAYEAAPTPVTTYLSVAPKIGAMAIIIRVFNHFIPAQALDLTYLLGILAMLTMSVGNLTALFQTNVKRMLAYSSVAQAGYLLIGFVVGTQLGREAVLIYSLVYMFMNVGAFAIVITLGNEEGYELEAYNGLAKRSFGLALLMTFFLLSLAGIPPLAGFVGKFYLFSSAIKAAAADAHHAQFFYTLAIVGVLNSVISAYYYMRVAKHMFFMEPNNPEPAPTGLFILGGLTIAAAGVLVLGIYPEPFLAIVHSSAEMLPQPGAAAIAPLP